MMMRVRKPFNLRLALIFWSLLLAIFSIYGSMKVVPEFIGALYTRGAFFSICKASFRDEPTIQFWIWLFIWSKVAELIDTLFVVLRKQKFLHLHWIHHALTLIYSFIVFGDLPAFCRWMVSMNFSVHVFMYSYYTLRAVGIRTPKTWSIAITSSQIMQMIIGFLISLTTSFYHISGSKCDVTLKSGILGVFVYGLFLILFLNFFYHSYLKKNSNATSRQKAE
ncbi:elongation of very long chain fatty acids protein 6-like protein [Dinothrombium tinctorium]|uniref:Elongation of very long chain fatty acids protein n=1 Tax=Dinothrombium tinctorium TaxID=1965070 RepID=A0A3S3NT61_9ACAR|nr:elongation of very long chain fatty acids protein 6-like protein [Dinothrombium tinctorium]